MNVREFIIPICTLLCFFIIQALGLVGEIGLTVLVAFATVLMWSQLYRTKEWLLLTIGIIAGSVIEIGLRFLGFQQVWSNASLFGVPYWLPLIWGFGFVVITRLGIYITAQSK